MKSGLDSHFLFRRVDEMKSIRFHLELWRLFGIEQIVCHETSNGRMTYDLARNSNFVYVFVVVLVILLGAYIQIHGIISDKQKETTDQRIVVVILEVACITSLSIVGVVCSIYFRVRFKNIMTRLENLKCYLYERKGSPKYTTKTPQTVVLLECALCLLVSSTILADLLVWFIAENDFQWFEVFLYFAYFVGLTIMMKFMYVAFYILELFATVNRLFSRTVRRISDTKCTGSPYDPVYSKSSRLRLVYLTNILQVHDKLYEIIAETNFAFGIQNLFMLVYFLEQLVCCPFLSIMNNSLFIGEKQGVNHFVYLYFTWTVVTLFMLISMLYPCSKIKDEIQELKRTICMHMNPLKRNFPDDYLQLFLMKLNKHYSGFMVLGIVEMELPLARHILASAVTYLVILLQF